MLPARSARRLRRILIVFYTTTIAISLLLSLPLSLSFFLSLPYQKRRRHAQNAKRRRSVSKWIERVELARFDAWEEGWEELGREARQSSRRQSYRRDIVPPIAIYIRPLSIQPYASATHTFRSSPPACPPLSLSLCGSNPLRRLPTHHPFHFNHPSTRPLSPPLSIYEVSTPLLTTTLRHHCAFATVPQCSRTPCWC